MSDGGNCYIYRSFPTHPLRGRNVNCLTVKTETHSRKRISWQHARNASQMLTLVAIKYARRSDKSSLSQNKAFIVKQETFNRWRTVVSGTWKYDYPRLNMSQEGAARVWHDQTKVVLFPCSTNDRVSYVLSSDQLNKLFSLRCLQNSVSVGYDLKFQSEMTYNRCV